MVKPASDPPPVAPLPYSAGRRTASSHVVVEAAGAQVADRDAFAARLRKDLARWSDAKQCWGVWRTGILGFLTFGLAPVIVWTFVLRREIERDRGLFTRAADWFRFHGRHPESTRLRDAAEGLYARPFLSLLPIACCVGVFLFFMASLNGARDRLGEARDATSRYPVGDRLGEFQAQGFDTMDLRDKQFLVWTGGMSAAYLCLLFAATDHAKSVRRFAAAFDRFAAAEGLAPPQRSPRPEPLGRWWIGGVVLTYLGAAWAPAAMIAAAGRRQIAVTTTSPLRESVADAVAAMSRVRRDSVVHAVAVVTCARPACAAPLPADAKFCRRCGARAPERA